MHNLGSPLLEMQTTTPVVFRWERQLNTKQNQFLIVTAEHVHLSALLSGRLATKLEAAVSAGPAELENQLKKGTSGKAVSLLRSEITSLSWIDGHKRIEIVSSDKKTGFIFDDRDAMQAVAEGLVPALGEAARSTEEVSTAEQLKLAAPALLGAIAFAIVMVVLDRGASEDYVATGRRQGMKNLVNDALVAAPPVVVWAIAALAVIASIVFVASRLKSPAERIRFSYALSTKA